MGRRWTPYVSVAVLLAAMIAAAEGDAETELAGPFPVSETPAGDFPVGHWEAWFEHSDFDKLATSNNPFPPSRAALALFINATVAELLPDGYGWILAIQTNDNNKSSNIDFNPDTAFRIEGVDRLYSRAGEIRWSLDPGGE